MDTIDDIVRMSIEDLFPDQTIPDKLSFLPDGNQYPAPDHSIYDGRLVIERKSRKVIDSSQFFHKIQEIAKSQGNEISGYGKINAKNIIAKMPDPTNATRDLIAYTTNKVVNRIKESRSKFENYAKYAPVINQVRMVIISDDSEIQESTDFWQFELGRRMGAYAANEDRFGIIDVIIFIKRPDLCLEKSKSHWFCCLVRKRLTEEQRALVIEVASSLHTRVSTHGEINGSTLNFPAGFTPLFV